MGTSQALSNPSIVITGASAGIGEDTAKLFAKRGWSVILGARRMSRLQDLVAEFNHAHKSHQDAGRMTAIELDVTKSESVARFAEQAFDIARGDVSVLLNNAGMALGTDPLSQGSAADWEVMLDTNVMGLLRVTRQFLPKMISKNSGHIINLGSIASNHVYEGGAVYCATKHAVRAITKTLRLEVNGTPVRVSLVDPGMVETDFSKVRFRNDEERAAKVYQGMIPLTGIDIAECIWFAATRPKHVNIEEIVLMPISQAAPHKVCRDQLLDISKKEFTPHGR